MKAWAFLSPKTSVVKQQKIKQLNVSDYRGIKTKTVKATYASNRELSLEMSGRKRELGEFSLSIN